LVNVTVKVYCLPRREEDASNDEAQDRVLEGARQALAIARGEFDPATDVVHSPDEIDVKALRKTLKLSQAAFAKRYGFNPARIRDWEQGRSRPDRAVRAYLLAIQREPEAVERALAA
jgi:putative transcriptional regulator